MDTQELPAAGIGWDVVERQLAIALAKRRQPEPHLRRMIRTDAGLNMLSLADALGVTLVTVSRWELGTRTPRGDLLVRYVELLDRLIQERGR